MKYKLKIKLSKVETVILYNSILHWNIASLPITHRILLTAIAKKLVTKLSLYPKSMSLMPEECVLIYILSDSLRLEPANSVLIPIITEVAKFIKNLEVILDHV